MTSSQLDRLRHFNPFASDTPIITALIAIISMITVFGLFMVLSASSVTSGLQNDGNFFADGFSQLAFAVVSAVACAFISRFHIDFWRHFRNWFVLGGMALQAAVLVAGNSYGGNRNWIVIFGVSIQPSELLKAAIIVWFATWIHDHQDLIEAPMSEWKEAGIWILVPLLLVAFGQDLGTMMIFGAILVGMLIFAGVPMRTVVAISAVGIFLALIFIGVGGSGRGSRISSWLEGCTLQDYETVCWQTLHGLWALSSGGLFGLGTGSSRAKWSWLPHSDSDYIFAIVGEELGMVGAIAVIALFVALAVTLIRLIRAYPQPLTRVLIGGVLIWIVGQAFVNIAVVLNLLPVLGVPLPFMSSGGSSLLANFLAFGVIISCVRYEERYG